MVQFDFLLEIKCGFAMIASNSEFSTSHTCFNNAMTWCAFWTDNSSSLAQYIVSLFPSEKVLGMAEHIFLSMVEC